MLHPGGKNMENQYLTNKKLELSSLFISPSLSLEDVWSKMEKEGRDIFIVADENKKPIGIVTHGDIRKALINLSDFKEPVANFMNKEPVTLLVSSKDEEIKKTISKQIEENSGNKVFLVNEQKRIIDIAYLDFKDNKVLVKRYSEGIPSKKIVLVTGGAGYLGSILVRMLLKKGYQVVVLDALYFGDEPIKDLYKNPNFFFIKGSIENIGDLAKALEMAHYVIHLAGIVGDPACSVDPLFTIQANLFATQVFIRMCKYYKIERFIFASSCSVYGISKDILNEDSPTNPISLYAKSKLEAERVLLGENSDITHVTIMRMATLHGWSYRPRFDLVVNLFSGKAATGEEIIIQGGSQRRPLLHVEDAANAYLLVLDAPKEKVSGEIFNIGSSNENYTILNLAMIIKERIPQVKISINPEVLDKRDYEVDFTKVSKILNFKTRISLKKSIDEVIQNVLERKINIRNPKFSNYLQALNYRVPVNAN